MRLELGVSKIFNSLQGACYKYILQEWSLNRQYPTRNKGHTRLILLKELMVYHRDEVSIENTMSSKEEGIGIPVLFTKLLVYTYFIVGDSIQMSTSVYGVWKGVYSHLNLL